MDDRIPFTFGPTAFDGTSFSVDFAQEWDSALPGAQFNRTWPSTVVVKHIRVVNTTASPCSFTMTALRMGGFETTTVVGALTVIEAYGTHDWYGSMCFTDAGAAANRRSMLVGQGYTGVYPSIVADNYVLTFQVEGEAMLSNVYVLRQP